MPSPVPNRWECCSQRASRLPQHNAIHTCKYHYRPQRIAAGYQCGQSRVTLSLLGSWRPGSFLSVETSLNKTPAGPDVLRGLRYSVLLQDTYLGIQWLKLPRALAQSARSMSWSGSWSLDCGVWGEEPSESKREHENEGHA